MPRRGPGNRPTGSEGWEIQCCKVRYPAALYVPGLGGRERVKVENCSRNRVKSKGLGTVGATVV